MAFLIINFVVLLNKKIRKLYILNGINSNLRWTKLSEKDYVKVQSLIDESLSQKKLDNELHELGRLAYDFINW